jgi:hypothetical protein
MRWPGYASNGQVPAIPLHRVAGLLVAVIMGIGLLLALWFLPQVTHRAAPLTWRNALDDYLAFTVEFILRKADLNKIAVRKGFSLLDLKRFAEAHAITATGYALDYPSLLEFQCPVLVPLYHPQTKMRHFVVVRGSLDDRVFLADPAVGRRTMLRADFGKEWEPKVGMVFEHPDMPTEGQNTPLGIHSTDAAYLSSATLRAVVLQSVDEYIHRPSEF